MNLRSLLTYDQDKFTYDEIFMGITPLILKGNYMSLRDYANINISFSAETVSRTGFGSLLFITEDTTKSSGMMTGSYASLEEVAEDYGAATEPYKFAQTAFAQGSGFSSLKFYHKDPIPDWNAALINAKDTDSDFYAVAIESRNASDLLDVAETAEALSVHFTAATDDSTVMDNTVTDDVASQLKDLNYSRTSLFYHSGAASAYPEAAWYGKVLPENPGTQNWAYRTLSGIPTEKFTSAQRQTLRDKRANYYEIVAGNGIVYAGYCSMDGIYIDVVRGLDWLQIRMQEDYVARQSASSRIPYINGDVIIESLIRNRMDIAVDRGVISEGYEVDVPRALDQQSSDRAARNFPGITFKATIIGAINSVTIKGTVSP